MKHNSPPITLNHSQIHFIALNQSQFTYITLNQSQFTYITLNPSQLISITLNQSQSTYCTPPYFITIHLHHPGPIIIHLDHLEPVTIHPRHLQPGTIYLPITLNVTTLITSVGLSLETNIDRISDMLVNERMPTPSSMFTACACHRGNSPGNMGCGAVIPYR